jgi:hypothetical protein
MPRNSPAVDLHTAWRAVRGLSSSLVGAFADPSGRRWLRNSDKLPGLMAYDPWH